MRMNFTIVRFVLLAAVLFHAPLAWCDAAAGLGESLRAAIEGYSASEPRPSKREAGDAFFAFEGSALDRDLAARDAALYRELEAQWMRLLAAMDQGDRKSVV